MVKKVENREGVKRCSRCGLNKDLINFCHDRKTPDGYNRWCRECSKIERKKYYKINKEKEKSESIKWQKKYPERTKESKKLWHKMNKERKIKEKENLVNCLSKEEAAYIAAFIDGEGTLSFAKNKATRSDLGYKGYYLNPRLTISNTNYEVLQWIKEKIGIGSINKQSGKSYDENPRWKICYIYQIVGNNLTIVLNQLLPYFIIKRDRAELLLEYFEEAPAKLYGEAYSSEVWIDRNEIHKKVVFLNRRGKE